MSITPIIISWKTNNNKKGILKCPTWWYDIGIHCNRIPAIKLINTYITLHIYFWGMEHLNSAFLPNFNHCVQYNTILSTTVTILYMISSNLIHPITEDLYHWPTSFRFSQPWHQLLVTISLLSAYTSSTFRESTYKDIM